MRTIIIVFLCFIAVTAHAVDGDVIPDGKIDIKDAVYTLQVIAELRNNDFGLDDDLSLIDVIYILKILTTAPALAQFSFEELMGNTFWDVYPDEDGVWGYDEFEFRPDTQWLYLRLGGDTEREYESPYYLTNEGWLRFEVSIWGNNYLGINVRTDNYWKICWKISKKDLQIGLDICDDQEFWFFNKEKALQFINDNNNGGTP